MRQVLRDYGGGFFVNRHLGDRLAQPRGCSGLKFVVAVTKLAPFGHVLRLSFADVDFDRRDLSERARTKLPDAFQADQARAAHQFVDDLPKKVMSVVVHREAGFSRSTAIALGLAASLGYQALISSAGSANGSILRLMVITTVKARAR
jgi:hypothetical protein